MIATGRPVPPLTVGLDIGGTTTAAALVDDDGTVLADVSLPSGHGPGRVLEVALAAVAETCAHAGVAPDRLAGVGVGIPGVVDPVSGHVRDAVNLGIVAADVAGPLRDHLGVPVHVENDVNAAALGAFHLFGRGPRVPTSLAYLNLGTGLGCGFVLDGRLWRGSAGVAGEVGHIPADPNGALCACGQRGCLETVCSAAAVGRSWPSATEPSPVALFRAADAGDPAAAALRDRVLEGVATAVRLVALSVDVDVVALGGGLSRIGDPLVAGVRDRLERMARRSSFLSALDLPSRVVLMDRSPTVVATLGAALLGREVVPA